MATSHKLLRWIFTVLASVWFFPVSCTTALGIGTSIVADHDARDASKGHTVHSSIAVVALPPRVPGEAFRYLLLANVPAFVGKDPEVSFLMPAKEGRISADGGVAVAYKVVSASAGEQTIETDYKDGDRSAWGRYRATRREVTPLASRLFVPGYMFGAFPYALVFALLIYFGARLVQRRIPEQ